MVRFVDRAARVAALALIALSGTTAHAIIFNFDYSGDGPKEGFNDSSTGIARKNALSYAANAWANVLSNSYANETITIAAEFNPLGTADGTIGSTGNNGWAHDFSSASPKYLANTFYTGALANHLKKVDIDGSTSPEIVMQFNSSLTFNYNPAVTSGSTLDFIATAIHEIGHGLGFADSIDPDTGRFTTFPNESSQTAVLNIPNSYDRLLQTGSTNSGTKLTSMSLADRKDAVISDNLFFSGPSEKAAFGNKSIQLYAPEPYEGGSSVSHIQQTFNDNDEPTNVKGANFPGTDLMQPYENGVHYRSVPQLDIGIISDIGWDVVPEPTGFAILSICLATTSILKRRRR